MVHKGHLVSLIAQALIWLGASGVGPSNAGAVSAPVFCPLPWTDPWVPDEAAAKKIYLAVAVARFPLNFKKYPVVTANDAGEAANSDQIPVCKGSDDEVSIQTNSRRAQRHGDFVFG
jgi:hypothetical protein